MRVNARSVLSLLAAILLFTGAFARPADVQAAQGTPDEIRPGVLLVGLRAANGPRVMALPGVASFGTTAPELQKLNVRRVEVPAGEEEAYRAKLLQEPQVLFVEPDYRVTAELIPDDTRWDQQYGPENVRAPEAWDVTSGSEDVIVAVLDSGVDAGHPDLSGRLISGYDFVDGDSTPQDQCGHGTHVTGILGANGNNNRGIAGIDWHAKLMPVRVLGNTCDGWISDVVAGLVWATDRGARIANMSLGTSSDSTLLQNGTYYAYSKGVALFAAAGNAGVSNLYYPARYTWVMAVGAVSQSNARAAFSNRSSSQEDMMVAAPGVQIMSTTPRSTFYYQYVFSTTQTYGYLSGTSMSTPHVSGGAALLASQGQFDSPDKIYQALYETALDLGDSGYDSLYGYGLVQLDRALAFTDFTPITPPPEADFTYDWVTSKDCGNLEYAWIDATGGTRLPVFGSEGWARVNLSFPFVFAGQAYETMAVSANGYLQFDIPSGSFTERDNFLIPGRAQPNLFIAPFWDDLNPSAGGLVYALDLGDRQVIEWWQIPRQGYTISESMLTFEVILSAGSNEILFQYQTLEGPGANGSSATVGLEYGDGYGGTLVSYNKPALSEEEAVLLVPAGDGSGTRNLRNCLFSTQSQFLGCNQMDPFGVDLFEGLIPDPPPPTTLTMRLLDKAAAWPGSFLSLDEFVEIKLEPSPPTPFDPEPLVCYRYTTHDVLRAGGHAENLFLATYSGGRWKKLPTVVNTQSSQIMALASHFSVFGVFASRPETLPVTGADYRLTLALVGVGLLALFGALLSRRR